MAVILKLGTRRSMLAMAQSRLVANAIMQANPGTEVTMVGIDTRGDQTLDTPLSQMEGQDFFVAELDNKLIAGEVDLTVHSMKDLSLDRPAEITLAAVPPRANPRDVVLFAPNILARLRSDLPIRIGTSSPRRIENAPPFLAQALPAVGGQPVFSTREIRGNVNTRVGYLHAEDDDPQRIDAVVLAFAGLSRLWQDEDGREALRPLLHKLRWMVLPLAECPSAPAQGALAIECRSADSATRELLEGLHCPAAAAAVEHERSILADWGGGCHQALGVTMETRAGLGELVYLRGRKPGSSITSEVRWQNQQTSLPGPYWDGTDWRRNCFTTRYLANLGEPVWLEQDGATLIAHSRALPNQWRERCATGNQRIWTSGVRSWLRLAAQGIWVEGCAEESGFEALLPTLQDPLLNLPPDEDWRVLTHRDGVGGWPGKRVTATYEAEATATIDENHPATKALQQARSIFWTSGSQYELFAEWVPDGALHACRHGKTYNSLRTLLQNKNNKGLTAYPSAAHWRTLSNSS